MYQAVIGSLQMSNLFFFFFATPDIKQPMRNLPSFLKLISIRATIPGQVFLMWSLSSSACIEVLATHQNHFHARRFINVLLPQHLVEVWNARLPGSTLSKGSNCLGRLIPWLYLRRSRAYHETRDPRKGRMSHNRWLGSLASHNLNFFF